MLSRDNTIPSLKENNIIKHSDITFQELPFVKKINLRGDSNNKNFILASSKILDAALPTEPNTYTNKGKLKIMWLGPNEWLIVYEAKNDKNDLLVKLQNVVGSKEASVTDISENRTILRMTGNKLFTLLAKFLVLDLNNNLAHQSFVAQTLFIKVPVLIVRNHNNNQIPEIDIFTNRSHANYIYELLVDSTKNLHF